MEVIWTQEAERQLTAWAVHCLQTNGKSTAASIMQRLLDTVACLAESPHIGPFLLRRGQGYREVMVPPYGKVVYRVVGNQVVVVALWDCRRGL